MKHVTYHNPKISSYIFSYFSEVFSFIFGKMSYIVLYFRGIVSYIVLYFRKKCPIFPIFFIEKPLRPLNIRWWFCLSHLYILAKCSDIRFFLFRCYIPKMYTLHYMYWWDRCLSYKARSLRSFLSLNNSLLSNRE